MKQKIFTLVLMLAFIVVGGKVFGQNSLAPYANGITSYNYTWTGITGTAATDGQAFYVTTTVPTITTSANSGSDYTMGTPTYGATSTIGITWDAASVGTTYYVVLMATSGTGCINFRYVEVHPATPPYFTINAIGVSGAAAGTGLAFANDAALLTVCPPDTRDGANYNSSDATTDVDGNMYVFYRINRVGGLATNQWTATTSFSPSIASSITATDYSLNGTSWLPATGAITNDLTVPTNTTYIIVRLTVPIPAGIVANAFTGSIDPLSTYETTALNLQVLDATTTGDPDNQEIFTVNNVPTIGGFSGN